MSQSAWPSRAILGFFTALALMGGAVTAAPITVVQNVPPLWSTTPDPSTFPTDFVGNPPAFTDSSQQLPHVFGGLEPGPHSYDLTTHTIHMANTRYENFVKYVFLKLVFAGTPTIPDPQSPGDTFDPTHWPTMTPAAQPGDHTPVVEAAGVDSGVTLVITMRWLLNPQPAFEEINITPLLQGRDVQPSSIQVQTVCVPSPAGPSLLAVMGIVAIARRRRT